MQNAANVKKQCKATYIISLIYSASQVFQWPTCHSKFRLSGIVRKLTNSVMTLMPAFHPFSSLLYRFSSLILSTRLALPESLSFSTWMMMVAGLPKLTRPTSLEAGNTDKKIYCKKPNPQHIQHSSLLCRCPMSSCLMASRRIGNRAWRCLIRHKPETDRRA